MNGQIHLYHGDGKGKTTAAIGLAIRAAGQGLRVVFVQFLKGSDTGEIHILRNIDGITVLRNEMDLGFLSHMTDTEKEKLRKMHQNSLDTAISLLSEKKVDLLILDEICAAYRHQVIDPELIRHLIQEKPDTLELVLTGRDPDPFFFQHADYITHMTCEKHPYTDKHLAARRGIEY